MTLDDSQPLLPPRPADGHKGTFGTVCVVGGQAAPPHVMLGGPALSALAALRSGAGLAVLAVPAPLVLGALAIAPSATGLALPVDEEGRLQPSATAAALDALPASVRCLAVGPGLGADEPQRQIVMRLIGQDRVPMVIDADALNCLAATPAPQLDLRANAILTPHPGEFARLAASLGITDDPMREASRPAAAAALSQRLGCVTVLKGHRTIVSDGLRVWTCSAGGAALATGGSGDVLTGVVAAMVAQFAPRTPREAQERERSLYDCARLGVLAHACAGDEWTKRFGDAGMLASDLPECLPAVLRAMRAAGGDPAAG